MLSVAEITDGLFSKNNEFLGHVNASEIAKVQIMPKGYNQALYILPFDHRGSFELKMFGWTGPLKPAQTAQIADAKKVIYDAFKVAVTGGVPKSHAGILVDEQFGADILRDARMQGFITACPAEKSGKTSSISSTARNSLSTSKQCTRPPARFWCATTRTETGA